MSNDFGRRQDEIKEYFAQRGYVCTGACPRDIMFKKNGRKMHITDQVKTFAVYAYGTDTEKNQYLKIFEEMGAIEGSVRRNPEASNPSKCCARWEHTADDFSLMFEIVKRILG